LVDALVDHDWAYSLRWFTDPETEETLGVDQWESVGPDAGKFGERFGGFVDPNCLLVDKVACEPALRLWCHPLPDDRTGMSADRNVFNYLRTHGRGVGTGRATVFYTLNPKDVNHAGRLGRLAAAKSAGKPYVGYQDGIEIKVHVDSAVEYPTPRLVPGIPSRVVRVEVRTKEQRHIVQVPEAEAWVISHMFEQHEYGRIPIERLKRPPVILDVGANVGIFALYAKLAFDRDATVHCFEPYAPVVELLRYNLAGFENVQVHPFGLGVSNRTAELLCTQKLTVANSMRPELVPNPSSRAPIDIRNAGDVWNELGLKEVDVLKLDTEGAEVEILESLGDRLNCIRVVLAEYHTQDDRRRIEALLPSHRLIEKLEYEARRGVVKYVRADLLV
jgi:FkbM family methyltransferase